ncbi:hypothetical protein KUTeg_007776 [Tegillarca granosa]|uniref:Uncharacterized protein n=1 Tax=Tegillarca granosa TaxID=220873 RepID=A0ABQ9FHI5_TEGGR|nr:hypothetical protein KUTeg_007776 [Tegillarca granosa]
MTFSQGLFLLHGWVSTLAVQDTGLLTSTLQTFPGSACEGEKLYLRCPNRTMISIQSAQYGRQVPSYRMCPAKTNQSHLSEYSFWNFREDTNCLATSSLMVFVYK